ncbi:sulfatase [Luteolibacter flavescens]|uniref:Sulfatase n=1 Tax=Luteolibacter flavescens TaxID=1859460 RepID=A0ABT3FX36_9BACT|nr:sulfatase [Luteolibacter flavescens]MCW1887794.1 sulfatase [Luteolibacter flavescens]
MRRLLLALAHVLCCGTATAAERPNVLVFIVDDMGWQDTSVPFHHDASGQPVVSALNRLYRTPHMERLAAQGMKFTRAYAHPVCTPSRISLMTGKNAARHRVTNWTNPAGTENGDNDVPHLRSPDGWGMKGISPDERPLPAVMKQSGYRTIHCGKAHFGSRGAFGQYPQAIGFDVNIAGNEIGHPASYFSRQDFGKGANHVTGLEKWHGTDGFLTDILTRELGDALTTVVEDRQQPFFAYMAHYAVHSPFMEDPRFAAGYPDLPPARRAYATLIEGMDRSLGDILAKLESLGVAEQTMVIFLSDNGGDAPIPNDKDAPVVSGNAPLRGKKGMRYEGGIRVPMIAAWAKPGPGNPFPIRPASHTDDLVAIADVFPTVASLAAIPGVAPWDGHDLTPYLKGDAAYHRPQSLVTHYPHGHNNDHFSILHDGPWKLIRNRADDSTELYNLAEDISESRNLATEHPERAKAMAEDLERRLDGYGALRSKVVGKAGP